MNPSNSRVVLKSVPDRFLSGEELEVQVILNRTLHRLDALWSMMNPIILDSFGSICPVGPMKGDAKVKELVVWDYQEKPRRFGDISDAFREEGIQKGEIWDLVWLLAVVRCRADLWQRFSNVIAIGSPISDGFSRGFPYLNGSAEIPCIKLVAEDCIGDPKRNFRYLARPPDFPSLRFEKSVLVKD